MPPKVQKTRAAVNLEYVTGECGNALIFVPGLGNLPFSFEKVLT